MKFILSVKHGPVGDAALWWRPDSKGYTTDLGQAGRYTEVEAMQICANGDDVAVDEQEVLNEAYLVLDFNRARRLAK